MEIEYQESCSDNKIRAKITFSNNGLVFYTPWRLTKNEIKDLIKFHFCEKNSDNYNSKLSERDNTSLEYLYEEHRYSKMQIKHVYFVCRRNATKANEVLSNVSLSKARIPMFSSDVFTNKYMRQI